MGWDPTKPGDTDQAKLFPALHRDNQLTLEQYLETEHADIPAAGAGTGKGRHKFGVGNDAARNAITDWLVGSIWLSTQAAARARLQRVVSLAPVVFEDVDANPAIPVGTIMVFFQAAAPTGWTQVITQNDKALRVVSGVGGGVGGTTAFSAAWPAHTHGHTLAVAGHTHTVPRDGWGTTGTVTVGRIGTQGNDAANNNISGSDAPGLTGAISNAAAFSPQFIDVILASKN